jgi:adhesin transport system membrane fusion protein
LNATRTPRYTPDVRTALQAVNTPRWVARLATGLVGAALATLLGLGAVPWQQTAAGQGSVIAYAPAERQQPVDAPIAGRVAVWRVREGERVTAGQVLVELRDNDALLLERILQEQALVDGQLAAAFGKVAAGEAKVAAAMSAREAAVMSAEAKVRAAEEKVRAEREVLAATEAALVTSELQEDRALSLAEGGLRSTQDAENAQLRTATARAKRDETEAKLAAAEAELAAALGEVAKARAEADGKVAASNAELLASRNEQADYQAKRLSVESKAARQEVQLVTAPADGFVVKVHGGQGGEQVRQGDPLITLVPDTESRAVAVRVDGNDARFLQPGQRVRLVFEGWPALQAAGWPNVSVGTWGGVIDFIDATDDGKGAFRAVVVPDPEDVDWPDGALLRQGVRANAWVLLGQVPLGYEVWRRLNDFPPDVPATEKAKDAADPVEREKAGSAWRK